MKSLQSLLWLNLKKRGILDPKSPVMSKMALMYFWVLLVSILLYCIQDSLCSWKPIACLEDESSSSVFFTCFALVNICKLPGRNWYSIYTMRMLTAVYYSSKSLWNTSGFHFQDHTYLSTAINIYYCFSDFM